MELMDWLIDLIMNCLSGNIDDKFETCEKLFSYIKYNYYKKKGIHIIYISGDYYEIIKIN